MRLTYSHFDFWARKHAPAYLTSFLNRGSYKPPKYLAINVCINDHAGWKPVSENTIHLLRSQRKHAPAGLLVYCMELGDHRGWSFNNVPRRAAWARKWARRIARQLGPDHYAEVCRQLAYSEVVAQYRAGKPAAHYMVKATAHTARGTND